MRIGMILDRSGGFPPDLRVEKESRALCAAGFDVALLCARATPDQQRDEVCHYGLKLRRVDVPRLSRLSRLAQGLRWAFTGSPVRAEWRKPIEDFLGQFRPDVLHCHDLPIVPAALAVTERSHLPVIADLHENWVSLRADRVATSPPLRKLRLKMIREVRKWERVECDTLRRCQRILIVSPESSDRLTRVYGIPQDRIVLVSNTEDEARFCGGGLDPDILERYRGFWTVSYIGDLAPNRGIATAIRAVAAVARQVPAFKLLLVGVRDKCGRRLACLARSLGVASHVEFVGWVPAEKVASYIAASAACLVPHLPSEYMRAALPHKLFQYMLMGKPVVVSDCASLERVVGESGAGPAFRGGDASDLARCLIELWHQGEEALARYGENGRRAALGPYAWRHDAQRLVEMYRQLEAALPHEA